MSAGATTAKSLAVATALTAAVVDTQAQELKSSALPSRDAGHNLTVEASAQRVVGYQHPANAPFLLAQAAPADPTSIRVVSAAQLAKEKKAAEEAFEKGTKVLHEARIENLIQKERASWLKRFEEAKDGTPVKKVLNSLEGRKAPAVVSKDEDVIAAVAIEKESAAKINALPTLKEKNEEVASLLAKLNGENAELAASNTKRLSDLNPKVNTEAISREFEKLAEVQARVYDIKFTGLRPNAQAHKAKEHQH